MLVKEVHGPKLLVATLAPGWLLGATLNVASSTLSRSPACTAHRAVRC